MNPLWTSHLTSAGALVADGSVIHFGDAGAELRAAAAGDVLADLSHLGVLRVEGPDSPTFVQGQFTNDARLVSLHAGQLSGYCSPKGRVLANFLLRGIHGGFDMELPAALAEPLRKRLTMFVLRSKVTLRDASDESVRLGLSGPNAAAAAARVAGPVPDEPYGAAVSDDATVVRLPGERFEIIAAPERAIALWNELKAQFASVGASAWQWLDIRHGLPWVTPATQEQFIPQMLDLDRLGAVSFKKGCYPGQEVVARTHYLGKAKRRLYRGHLDQGSPHAGDALYSPDADELQAADRIVNVQAAPGGGFDLLAVCHSTDGGRVHLADANGPQLRLEPVHSED